ncbi:MAG TPA: DUF4437 domain-containing protein [Candidatus Dormibacteraeota bacterium]
MVSDDWNNEGGSVIVDALASLELEPRRMPIYDREIGLRLLAIDERTGAEHYVVRYPQGMRAQPHWHSASQTILVIEGSLEVNGSVIGAGGYCHLPGGVPMHHGPANGSHCVFVSIFAGAFDVHTAD